MGGSGSIVQFISCSVQGKYVYTVIEKVSVPKCATFTAHESIQIQLHVLRKARRLPAITQSVCNRLYMCSTHEKASFAASKR